MSKAFLTEDTPSLFENVCQVSKRTSKANRTKANKKPSKSDYLELRKSLKEITFESEEAKDLQKFHFKSYYYLLKNSKNADKEFDLMYNFLKKNFRDFKLIFKEMDIENNGYYDKDAKICDFIKNIKDALFKKLYADSRIYNINKIRKEGLARVIDQKDYYPELITEKKPVSKRLRLLRKEWYRYKMLLSKFQYISLIGFFSYPHMNKFYSENKQKIENCLKANHIYFNSHLQRMRKKGTDRYQVNFYNEIAVNQYLIFCFESFVKVLTSDKEKMREFVRLLELIKQKTKPLTIKYLNKIADFSHIYRDRDYYFRIEFFKKLKRNSKAIRDYLKAQKKEEKE